MKRFKFYVICLFLMTAFFACKNEQKRSFSKDEIQWKNINEALEDPNTEGKRYLVNIETDSCKWCTVMNEKTFTFPSLAEFINENYIPVKFDTKLQDSLMFQGTLYGPKKIGRLPIHALADKWLNYWYNYPTVIIFDKDFNQLLKFSGYKDPDQFLLELKKM